MTFDIGALIVAFLGGGAVAAILFMFGYADRLTKVETQLKGMVTTLKEIKDAGHISPCPASQAVNVKVAVIDQRVTDLEARNKAGA